MSALRSPELRRWLILYLLAAALVTGSGFFAGGIRSARVCFAGSLLFLLLIFLQTRARYREIAAFTKEIDRLLHGAENVALDAYAEGELAILQNEIGKLTLELRHRADALRELQKLLARMDWLITALLKMAQLDSNTARFRKERVSARTLINKAAEPLAIPMELRGQTLRLELNGDPAFEGDLAWSGEALGNILKNCMEHTPTGGTITVTAEENALYCGLTVRDNGPGIDPDDLPHLFERFYRGKNAADTSIGIGLALTRMIAAEQNGTVKAENLPQGGAQFTLRFYKEII